MTTTVIQLGTLALAVQKLSKAPTKPQPVHHLVAIDISGSMYSDLPALRLHLKNKLATLVAENDTVSLIWFSGKGQVGTVVEALRIRNVSDLSMLHSAIERFLVPTGLTGFKEPLQAAQDLINRLSHAGGGLFNLLFMTDGYDNQWPEAEILELCASLTKKLDHAAVIEYGWNCNRPMLTKMAEALGGKLVFSGDFESYAVAFADSLAGTTKKMPVTLKHKLAQGSVFSMSGENLLNFTPDAEGVVWVPEGQEAIAYFCDASGKSYDRTKHTQPLVFASLAALSQRMDTNNVFNVLGALGDVALIEQFGNCFSKEDYNKFQEVVLAAAVNPKKRYAAGFDEKAVPKEDAYTVLHMLADLARDPENLVYPNHPSFKYEKIGASYELEDTALEFKVGNPLQGYPFDGLVWNEDRPNVSFRVKMEGFVDLPATRPAPLPATLPTFIYRSYTVVRDGIVHTRTLPVSLTKDTFDKLQANGLLVGEMWFAGKIYQLAYPKLPVINRKMVTNCTAAETFESVLDLMYLRGAQKVLGAYRDKLSPKMATGYLDAYGSEATAYLKTLGLTDYSGFNPASSRVRSGDYYLAKELKTHIVGLTSLAKVSDVEAAMAAGKKLKLSEFVMAPTITKIENFKKSSTYLLADDPQEEFIHWLTEELEATTKMVRDLTQTLAQKKFAIVVGQRWFNDLGSLENTTLTLDVDGYSKVTCVASLKEIQIAT